MKKIPTVFPQIERYSPPKRTHIRTAYTCNTTHHICIEYMYIYITQPYFDRFGFQVNLFTTDDDASSIYDKYLHFLSNIYQIAHSIYRFDIYLINMNSINNLMSILHFNPLLIYVFRNCFKYVLCLPKIWASDTVSHNWLRATNYLWVYLISTECIRKKNKSTHSRDSYIIDFNSIT